jgi:hypothetical protein
MTRIKQATIGADIEVFVAGTEVKKIMKAERFVDPDLELQIREVTAEKLVPKGIIPCVGIFPGTKAKPYTPKGWEPGYAIQEDNVMLEFNIPPASTSSQLLHTLGRAKDYVTAICAEKKLIPMWNVPEHQFKPIDLTTPQAKLFGCEPDMDAYTGGIQRDTVPSFGRYRTCGGHIHMGGDFNCPDFVAVLFLELILSLYLGSSFVHQVNTQRAKWYGKPGVYRTKPYGIEYRSLSNHWINNAYGMQDMSTILFKVADMLIANDASQLQQWFRRIEWTLLQDGLLKSHHTSKDQRVKNNQRWHTLRQQFNACSIPGLQL